jgi:hypothetical protein
LVLMVSGLVGLAEPAGGILYTLYREVFCGFVVRSWRGCVLRRGSLCQLALWILKWDTKCRLVNGLRVVSEMSARLSLPIEGVASLGAAAYARLGELVNVRLVGVASHKQAAYAGVSGSLYYGSELQGRERSVYPCWSNRSLIEAFSKKESFILMCNGLSHCAESLTSLRKILVVVCSAVVSGFGHGSSAENNKQQAANCGSWWKFSYFLSNPIVGLGPALDLFAGAFSCL